jgi:hypothetical protein
MHDRWIFIQKVDKTGHAVPLPCTAPRSATPAWGMNHNFIFCLQTTRDHLVRPCEVVRRQAKGMKGRKASEARTSSVSAAIFDPLEYRQFPDRDVSWLSADEKLQSTMGPFSKTRVFLWHTTGIRGLPNCWGQLGRGSAFPGPLRRWTCLPGWTELAMGIPNVSPNYLRALVLIHWDISRTWSE